MMDKRKAMFQIGEAVRLKSGGQEMLVDRVTAPFGLYCYACPGSEEGIPYLKITAKSRLRA
jgi:hypothetical protein